MKSLCLTVHIYETLQTNLHNLQRTSRTFFRNTSLSILFRSTVQNEVVPSGEREPLGHITDYRYEEV